MMGFRRNTEGTRALALVVVSLSLVAAACAAQGGTEGSAVSTDTDTLPVQTISYYEPPIGSIEDLADISAVVVVATLQDVQPGVLTYVESSAEDPAAGKVDYDGYVFSPSQWVKGRLDGPLVVLRETMMRRADGTPVSRLQPNGYPIERADIGRSYLLFLAPAYGGTVGEFFVPASSFYGVVEVRVDGTMVRFAPDDRRDPIYDLRDEKVEAVIARLMG